ncbi:MAG: penicillin-binding transpeptidase domain-containing protein [Acidimicrobiia bacterium]
MSDNSRVRVSIVGVVVVVLFSTLLARLWFLQSGPEDSLKVQAVVDSTRVIQTQSPRGEILDRNGEVLVKDAASWAVTVDRTLSKRTAARVLGQLAEQLGVPERVLESQYTSLRQSPLEPAVVALDVNQPDRLAILQDPEDYPGVHVVELTVRSYPQGDLAAQVLGYVGEINATQLAHMKKLGYEAGDEIGEAGAEAAFESVLRGKPRRETIEVDPAGLQVGGPISVDPGSAGDNVYLTIDANVQRAAETSLKDGILSARHLQDTNVAAQGYATLKAPAGAVVVLDAENGTVAALASYPTYPLKWWVGGISTAHYALLNNPASNDPLLDRATQGLYAPGSTFKLVTALAMAQDGIQSVGQYFDDQGQVDLEGTTVKNAQGERFGEVNLQQALTVSSDAYFATVGDTFWHLWKGGDTAQGLGIQTEARELGFDAATGIELGDNAGRVPDPAWKSAFANANYSSAVQKRENGTWLPSDNFFMAIGQGDLVATPLQLANAYAAFDNDGTLWRPRIEDKVVNAAGKPVEQVTSNVIRHVTFDPTARAVIQAGFDGAVSQSNPPGTAYQAFQGFPLAQYPVSGKTGTAQVKNKGDTSLFVAMFSADGTPYVAVVVVEQAGFGAQTAAPIARRIIEAMDHLPAPEVVAIDTGHD